ncbi:PilZ domain-containing protein [Marinobacter zhejiangensis]|uniref:PilZ domain-containing protein n=1 Tax=Marinobacter zhejiangensis TaxID=488535 RepID=A0A1I4NG69_9GAMM|nr:PilZ domain-containing protein [Marinobacter zhejiangensis]SFM14501.1 PilZ domain-containing protein [Marinobacter zhejiangensis]
MMPDSADRRIKERYAAQCLKVSLRERGFFGREKKPTTVCCLDMNRYGMGILSPRPVEPGSRLLLDFHGKYISETNVRAMVVDCYPYQSGFRVGVQFTNFLCQRSYSRAVDNALSRIEAIYNRYAS